MPKAKSAPATNRILQTLSPQEGARLLARHQQVTLTYGAILCEYGKPLRHVYFLNSGIVSLLVPVAGHPSVEVGMVGREGMAGMALFLGVKFSPVRMLVQGAGTAMRIEAAAFHAEIKRNPLLQRELNRYLFGFMAQVSQTAGCNSFHQIGARLARWLLMTQDRVGTDKFEVTHEFLAHMLGVRRSGVSLAARILQKKKLIHYSRGKLTILHRKGLERAACACYESVTKLQKLARIRSEIIFAAA